VQHSSIAAPTIRHFAREDEGVNARRRGEYGSTVIELPCSFLDKRQREERAVVSMEKAASIMR
jgi:hypothetical protein